MIRCTARSVIPTSNATSRSTTEGFRDNSISTCEWFVKNVQLERVTSNGGAIRGVATGERGLDCGGAARKAVRERVRGESIRFSRADFMKSTQSLDKETLLNFSKPNAKRKY